MPSSTVVIAQNDPTIAQGLANDLHAHFGRVAVAEDAVELRTLLLRHEARVAVLDLEVCESGGSTSVGSQFLQSDDCLHTSLPRRADVDGRTECWSS